MTYIDRRYIHRAWESEMRHHERTIAHLRIKLDKLVKELTWELDQHHARLKELHRLDEATAGKTSSRQDSRTSSYRWEHSHHFSALSNPSAMHESVK